MNSLRVEINPFESINFLFLSIAYNPYNRAENTISIENNGKGIPIVIHAKEKVYVPELIFGHLLTSSNYDDNEKKARNNILDVK